MPDIGVLVSNVNEGPVDTFDLCIGVTMVCLPHDQTEANETTFSAEHDSMPKIISAASAFVSVDSVCIASTFRQPDRK